MKLGDQQLGTPQALYKGTQSAIEALTGVPEGAVAYATDLNLLGTYDGSTWTWGSGTGVASVTGDGVDNTDPENPVLSFPSPGDIGAATAAQGALADSAVQPGDLTTDITPKDGWIADTHTWSYSSVDSPTGVISINANMTTLLYEKMRISITQTQALTAYFPMDSSSTPFGGFSTTDTAMTYTSGKFSNAATFNGTTSKIVVTDAAGLKPTGDFTLGCWFKTSATGAQKQIFASYSLNTNVAGMQFSVNSSNFLRLVIGNNTGGAAAVNVSYVDLAGTTTVTDGAWHYAVCTYRNNYAQIYLDGKLEAESYVPVPPAYAATNYVRIGCMNLGAGAGDQFFFNGQIDDLFLINGYALDEATVYAKYLAGTAQGPNAISVEKMGLITAVGAYSGSATLVTIYFGTDYLLTNDTITSPRYSRLDFPARFPANPNKWSVVVKSYVRASKTTPAANTWYGTSLLSSAGPSITIPAGHWNIPYKALIGFSDTTVTAFNCYVTISTANNIAGYAEAAALLAFTTPSGSYAFILQLSHSFQLRLATKTTVMMNLLTTTATADIIEIRGDLIPTVIRAVSALL